MKRAYIKHKKLADKSDFKKLEVALDKLILEILKLRDKKCVQCGSSEITTGHVFGRRVKSTHWDLENCYAQCAICNGNHENNRQPYYEWVIERIGKERFEALKKRWDRQTKIYSTDLEEMKKELEQIKENKDPKYWCNLTYSKCNFMHGRCVHCGEIEHLVERENSARATMLASESVLARDWLCEEEDEAWKNL